MTCRLSKIRHQACNSIVYIHLSQIEYSFYHIFAYTYFCSMYPITCIVISPSFIPHISIVVCVIVVDIYKAFDGVQKTYYFMLSN